MTRIRGFVSSKYRQLRFTPETYGDEELRTIAPPPHLVLPLSRDYISNPVAECTGRGSDAYFDQ
jgi:hypothetical protein